MKTDSFANTPNPLFEAQEDSDLFRGDRFTQSIAVSVAAHTILFLIFAVRAAFFPSEPIRLDDAIRVDIVALPDKSVKELPPEPSTNPAPVTAQTEPVKEQPKPIATPVPVKEAAPAAPVVPDKKLPPPKPKDEKINLKKAHQDQASALKRLEAMQRLEQMEALERQQQIAKSRPSSGAVKGNQISHGGSLSGIARAEYQGYLETVKTSAKRRWNLPAWMGGANLSTRVRIFINAHGLVMKRQITQASGNPTYDEIVLAAIDSSSPLPVPPGDLVDVLENSGVEIEFVP